MNVNPYNRAQWEWVADRLGEGYPISEISELLGMHSNSIRDNLERIARRIPVEERVPLFYRKREFYALVDKENDE